MAIISQKKPIDNVGACTFCTKGEMKNGRLEYPYKEVHELSSSGRGNVIVTICTDCLKDIAEFVKRTK